ncbi:MAG: hypothetical protein ETSY1_07720 [Candidatus Entotheonella factor]|uniref:Mce/MlaD domain-containing protein n=1 Tax=Entotheonella factor TaxID=1429438 RepID=W4LUG8_ENTF1|nr:MAG: hypothetical protein ETSY1_07720 [Candidatus Entotheonella factor]
MKANPTAIGTFIVGAVALILASVIVFGGGSLFTETVSFVLYFRGSVNGLNVGAPVKFRGVRVGSVTEIRALYDPSNYSALIQVGIKIEPSRFSEITDGAITSAATRKPEEIEALIERGLRGQLQVESFVTGLLFVSLNFKPDSPVILVNLTDDDRELPTIPTTLEKVSETVQEAVERLGQLPLEQLLGEIVTTLQHLNSILTTSDMDQGLQALNSILQEADKAVSALSPQVPRLIEQLGVTAQTATRTLETVGATLTDTRQLIRRIDGQAQPLLESAQSTLTVARGALGQAQKTLKALEDAAPPALDKAENAFAAVVELADSESAVVNDLSRSLEALEEAARSVRLLADYLQRNPESLLRGRGRARSR